jgi:hypothetical protein
MESVKSGLLNFCKGFGIWFVLLLLNTRSGEAGVNGIKIVLDVILAIIFVGSYKNGKYVALLVAALTTMLTVLPLAVGLEILLLLGSVVLGGILLKAVPEDDPVSHEADYTQTYVYGACENTQQMWRSRNFFNPFESYSYSPDGGVSICKGIIRRSFSTIPTTTTRARIHQNIWQRLLGFCDVSFQNNYTGQQFGEDLLKNIRFQSAMELMQMMS